jgi:hypothetical protein
MGCDSVYESRNRVLEGDLARQFLAEVVRQAEAKGLTSGEHSHRGRRRDRSVGQPKELPARG